MRVVVAHNFYQQPGGEDQVFASEVQLLRRHGHDPAQYILHNDRVDRMGRLAVIGATVWNRRSAAELGALVRAHRADVVHFHNTFPLMSPAAYAAARAEGAAVVQTLHNFRLVCPNALLFRDGGQCEECLGRPVAWPGVVHRCYRGSRAASAVVAATLTIHRAIGTWRNAVDVYIAPSEFARRKLIAGGLPVEKIAVKPNFLDPDPGAGDGSGGFAVFVGRLSQEKGLDVLLDAWSGAGGVKLKIIGDGPLAPLVRDHVSRNPNVEWLGRRSSQEVYEWVGRAAALIFPSQCYETFGRVVIEAFAKGTPVIAYRHGTGAELVGEGRTGYLFDDAADLAAKVRPLAAGGAGLAAMRPAARREYETNYTGGRNYQLLMALYRRAAEAAGARAARLPHHAAGPPVAPAAGKRT